MAARAGEELDRVIRDEGLDPVRTRAFMASAFRDGAIAVTGTAITTIMPPRSRFSPDSDHAAKKQTVLAKLAAYLDRFLGLL